jgi:RimJ/RimL family protein N-acetyltransferase
MIVAETDRLLLRHIEHADAAFIHALLTDAEFLAQIGDRGVRTLEDASRAIAERFQASYRDNGFGMYAVEGKVEGIPLGMAGLIRREGLEHVDIGYAFLPAGRGCGYATEAAHAVMALAAGKGVAPVVAIVTPGNVASIAVLRSLGLVAGRLVRMPGAGHDVMLYVPAALLSSG